MKWLHLFFLHHWERKATSFLLAIVVWLIVNSSTTIVKELDNVSVRLTNISNKVSIEGLQPNHYLSQKISLKLHGNKSQINDLSSNDLEIVLDAKNISEDWLAPIFHKNLVSLNPYIDLSTVVKRISPQYIPIHFSRMIKEKVPLTFSHPIGKPPQGYEYLGIWPNRFMITLQGPENIIKPLKAEGITFTFNLNDIPKGALELQESSQLYREEISYCVPNEWKNLELPSLPNRSFSIDDPRAEELCIQFVRNDLLPLENPVPIHLFFSPKHSSIVNPKNYFLNIGKIVREVNGFYFLDQPLYVKGASKVFLNVIQEMLRLSIFVLPKSEKNYLDWSIEFFNSRLLEDRYVSLLLAEDQPTLTPLHSKRKEEYLRHRFRSYMNHLQFYQNQDQKLDLKIKVKGKMIVVEGVKNEKNCSY